MRRHPSPPPLPDAASVHRTPYFRITRLHETRPYQMPVLPTAVEPVDPWSSTALSSTVRPRDDVPRSHPKPIRR